MIDLTVGGMTCGGCAKAVEKAVKRVDPDAEVAVDLATGTVRIGSPKAREEFSAAIAGAGYEVAA